MEPAAAQGPALGELPEHPEPERYVEREITLACSPALLQGYKWLLSNNLMFNSNYSDKYLFLIYIIAS